MGKVNNYLENTYDIALKRRANYIVTGLNLNGAEKVLDAGCGDGFYIKLLKTLYPASELYGIDIDKKALAVAKKNLDSLYKLVSIKERSITNSKFDSNYFDRVFASEVFEHIPEDNDAFKECFRILKPGGLLILTVPNHNFPFMWDPINKMLQNVFKTHIKSGFFAGIWNQHVRLYTVDELINKGIANNFNLLQVKNVTHYSLPFHHYILNIGARLLHDTNVFSSDFKTDINKFEISNSKSKRPLILRIYNSVCKFIDKYNDNVLLSHSSVSIFVVFQKPYK